MLSTTVIEQPFKLLVIDTTNNHEGWEWDISNRLLTVLGKRGVELVKDSPAMGADPRELERHSDSLSEASCIVLFGTSNGDSGSSVLVWNWLSSHVEGQKLAAVCEWGRHSPELTDAVLKSPSTWAAIAIAQESDVAPREGALFMLKFLAEMDLHSDDRVTGRMAWFAWKKADALVKRRRMDVRFGLRT